MDIDRAREFVRNNPRAVLVTRKRDTSPQLSPILATVDDDGRLMISSRETAFKTKNARRDPRVSLCFLNEGFFGDWIQIDGTTEVVSLPDAMELLVDYYRRAQGEHENWEEYRQAMRDQKRVMMLVTIDRAGPDRSG